MIKNGLYLPRIFKFQSYNNYLDIKFEKLENGEFFVDIGIFRELYKDNFKIFDFTITELILRGGKFILDKPSNLFKDINIISPQYINVPKYLESNAFEKLDLSILNISEINKNLDINSNDFFSFIPLEGFKIFKLSEKDLEILKKDFISCGFEFKNSNDIFLELVNK